MDSRVCDASSAHDSGDAMARRLLEAEGIDLTGYDARRLLTEAREDLAYALKPSSLWLDELQPARRLLHARWRRLAKNNPAAAHPWPSPEAKREALNAAAAAIRVATGSV